MENLEMELAEAEMVLAQKRVALLRAQAQAGAIATVQQATLGGGEHAPEQPHEAAGAITVLGVDVAEQVALAGVDAQPTEPIEMGDQPLGPGEQATTERLGNGDDSVHGADFPADAEADELPPVTVLSEVDGMQVDALANAQTGTTDDAPPAQDEEDEVEDELNDEQQDAGSHTAAVVADIDEHESGGPMLRPAFMRRAFNFTGLVWQDSASREGVDAGAAQFMVRETMAFEAGNYNQAWGRAPIPIQSARQWASKSRMPTKIYNKVPEVDFTVLVTRMWRAIRGMDYNDVRRMNGRFGLIGVVRAVYQANALNHDAEEDFRVIMNDVGRALQALRYPDDAPAGTVLEVLTWLDPAPTDDATAVIDRIAGGEEVIEIDDDEDEDDASPPSPKKKKKDDDDKDKGGASGGSKRSPKRKAGSTAGSKASPKKKAKV
ncbi:hypothetical protein PENSPDRAFT_299393 [Peniophora sp. CONT]|nr:hypothetical protein PENSPDRAFT_299393 [Peniophora sp. CONT]